ncbi:MAG TPA: diacylglycerol kinase family protein [Ornithinimicrobium sp.]|uniref:diacylglycerol/lipid kinase family protein n=1 Tax=Ornithinimicrobium sp. TaxID=1977084 RepID=UPI002B4AA56E|nr:diacylglycerol kinase family protein [Ornithinimicrobium sp.]HKJ12498.1 diacylglycerol kinase family protein [Ornithinimicrobium sp.]
MRYAVLFGRRSGRRDGSGVLGQTMEGLARRGHDVVRLRAPDLSSAHAACAQAVADGVEVLVVVGGDGAVRLAASHCVGSPTAVAVVPSGSGNDTAASLGVPSAVEGAIEVAAAGTTRRIDVIRVEDGQHSSASGSAGHIVVGSVPAALDARIAARSLGLPSALGPMRYAAATLAEIPRLAARDYRLTLDGRERECSTLVLTVCNLPLFGGGMRIAPDADPVDGLLDVVTIDTVNPLAALGLLRKVFTGTHATHRAVRIQRCAQVRVEGPALTAFGDGDPIGALPLTCTAVPAALKVVVQGPADQGSAST